MARRSHTPRDAQGSRAPQSPRARRSGTSSDPARSMRPSRRRSAAGAGGSAGRTPSGGYGFPGTSGLDSNRAFIPIVIFLLFAAVIFLRLFYLQVIVAPTYTAQAEEARTISYEITPRRGTIYDRNGTVLATSVDARTIYANPTEVEDVHATALQLADVLGGKASDYEDIMNASDTTFAFIKQKQDVVVGEQIDALELAGIYTLPDARRVYPNGQVGGQVIGACDTDGNGTSGLEYYYDDILSGTPGEYQAERGRDGTPIPGGVSVSVSAIDGQDIIISLDIELQQSVEARLTADEKGITANGASAVVMDGGTGEIYAAASLPLFNPADRSEVKEGSTELKVVTDLFEPGSIFKTVSATSILETGSMKPDTELFCPSYIEADGYIIEDAHERGDATYTLRQIMDQSSNIGISLAVENMGFEELYNHIITYNLHKRTGVDYPGEGEVGTDILGALQPFDKWSKVTGYNVSFGQGVSVTPLQITRFYGALVNDGVECTPHFLISKPQSNKVLEYATEDVIENKAAIADMTSMLQTVVTEGTGTQAAIEGFDVAGKTSTAEIYDEVNGGYRAGVYNLCFTGFLANSSSQLVCFVGANEVPTDGVVTPIFKDIMTTAIDRFKITP